MIQLVAAAAILVAAWLAINWLKRASSGARRKATRMAAGVVMIVAGIVLSLRGVIDIGLPLAIAGLAMVRAKPLGDAWTALRRPLELYLDRRFPGWRHAVNDGAQARMGSAPDTGAMSEKEAYQILGLQPGAGTDQIQAAYRRLIAAVHPDRGGSTFLAARINLARDFLLANKH